jgi:hypothetical protein
MLLEAEGRRPIENVTEAQVRAAILRLRSQGPSSFASLTDSDGNYLQAAGGQATCMLERRDAVHGRHYRAHMNERSKVFSDGALLAFGAGKIELAADEWLLASLVAEAFVAFLNGSELPSAILWREVTDSLRTS